jgi:hypothetical protein
MFLKLHRLCCAKLRVFPQADRPAVGTGARRVTLIADLAMDL